MSQIAPSREFARAYSELEDDLLLNFKLDILIE